MSVILLPKNLEALAPLASKESVRYALNGVHVIDQGKTYIAEATDGKVMGRVEGTKIDDSKYPVKSINGLASAPNTAHDGVIPTADFIAACKNINLKKVKATPILGHVACVLGKDIATMATTDGQNPRMMQPKVVQGRFPDVSQIIPKDKPTASFAVDGNLFIKLLSAAGQYSELSDTGVLPVCIEFHQKDNGEHLLVAKSHVNGQRFIGMQICLSGMNDKERAKEWAKSLGGKPPVVKEEEEIEDSPPASAPPDTPEDEQPYDDSGDDDDEPPTPPKEDATMDKMPKWTSEVGPRLTKKFEQAWGKLKHLVNTFTRKTNTDPEGTSYWTPFLKPEQQNQAAIKMMQAIGDRVAWTITKDNLEPLIKTISQAVKVIPPNIVDERTSEVEQIEEHKRLAEAKAKQEADAKLHKIAFDKALAALKQKYPWAKQNDGKISDHARCAANMRKLLEITYPGVKFSAKSESYSGGSSINVKWELGPTTHEVDALISGCDKGTFDGMTDSYEYDHDPENEAWRVHFGAVRHTFTNRDVDSIKEQVQRWLCDHYQVEYTGPNTQVIGNDRYTVSDHAYHAIGNTSFPAGAVPTGVADIPDDIRLSRYASRFSGYMWVTFETPAPTPAADHPVAGDLVPLTWHEQYTKLQADHPDDLILFKMGDFYEAYGDNAQILKDELNLVVTSRNDIPMASIAYHSLARHTDTLKAAGYTITVGEVVRSKPGRACHVEKHFHTKRQFDFWVVVLEFDMPTPEFNKYRQACEANDGWYSRAWKPTKTPGGFAFKSEEAAIKFAATI